MTTRAVDSGLHNATLLGASSPTMMCRAVIRTKASVPATAKAVASRRATGSAATSGSSSRATAGSPIHPSPRLAIVIPNCVAAMKASGFSAARSTRRARLEPRSISGMRRVRRTETMANSAATNIPFAATSASTAPRRSRTEVTDGSMGCHSSGGLHKAFPGGGVAPCRGFLAY